MSGLASNALAASMSSSVSFGGRPPVRPARLGAATHDRLVQVKRKYDPANFFRLNQNIVPG
jgi:Berberine and berberine like